jgi:hypothetical protein
MSLIINKNSANNCIFTLSELTTLTGTSPYYLFKLVSDDNEQNTILFTGEDTSINKIRYNQFNIIETGSSYVNLTASTINLLTPGYYHYEVYQQYSQTNLALSGVTGGPIEYGKFYLSGATIELINTVYSGESRVYVYNN